MFHAFARQLLSSLVNRHQEKIPIHANRYQRAPRAEYRSARFTRTVFERVISSGNGYYPTLYIEGNIYLGRSDGVTYVDDTGARAPVLVSTPANLDLGTYELTTRSYESLIK